MSEHYCGRKELQPRIFYIEPDKRNQELVVQEGLRKRGIPEIKQADDTIFRHLLSVTFEIHLYSCESETFVLKGYEAGNSLVVSVYCNRTRM